MDPLGVSGHMGRALRSSRTMIRKSVAEILQKHVTFELEAIDRMYLNAYVPSLQTGAGFVYFLKTQLGARVPSTMMVAPMSERFVEAINRFVEREGIDLVTFDKGQRKDDIAQQYLAAFEDVRIAPVKGRVDALCAPHSDANHVPASRPPSRRQPFERDRAARTRRVFVFSRARGMVTTGKSPYETRSCRGSEGRI